MLHKNLSRLIFERDIKKTDLATHLGVSRVTLNYYLNGTWAVPSDVLEKTAAYFNVSIGSLFGETDTDTDIQKQLKQQQKQTKTTTKTDKPTN